MGIMKGEFIQCDQCFKTLSLYSGEIKHWITVSRYGADKTFFYGDFCSEDCFNAKFKGGASEELQAERIKNLSAKIAK